MNVTLGLGLRSSFFGNTVKEIYLQYPIQFVFNGVTLRREKDPILKVTVA
jgi:hypothetical protein